MHRTFVVQLFDVPEGICGRAEHVASGAVEHFESLAELVDFFTRFARRSR